MSTVKDRKTILLPQRQWKDYERFIKSLGEQEDPGWNGDDKEFLQDIGILTDDFGPLGVELTDVGDQYFGEKFIRGSDVEARGLLKLCLLEYPPVEAIVQLLWGVKNASTQNVLTVLKARGFWMYETTSLLTHFLNLLNEVGIVKYDKKNKRVVVLESPSAETPPRNIFIDPSKPYSNIHWVKKIIGECEGFIYWLDKNFQKEALEWIWEIADANKVKEIKILSLGTGENLNRRAKDEYRRLKKELSLKGIDLVWYVIDSKEIRNNHDRWIIGRDYLRNVPNVNAILSGQRSELNRSENCEEAYGFFREYLQKASPVEI